MTSTTQDIGIVLLPNKECKGFASLITEVVSEALPDLTKLPNNPHVTMIHIANQTEQDVVVLKENFDKLYANNSSLKSFNLPVTGVKATGGSPEIGYKWVDLQFETPEYLVSLRDQAVKTFCPFHKGILTRMYDDGGNFIEDSQASKDIAECGVTFSNYLPHVTAWYVDLPQENKVTELGIIADIMQPDELNCMAEDVALVDLGRNGNASTIIKQYSLDRPVEKQSVDNLLEQGVGIALGAVLIIYLVSRFRKKK